MRLIYTVCGSQEEANALAAWLVTGKLAACVNILAPITSVYQWEGRLETAVEVPLLVKTMAEKTEQVFTAMKEKHSYNIPVILSWEAESLNPAYTEWMKQSLQ